MNRNLAAIATLLRAEAARIETDLDELRDAGAGRCDAPPEALALYVATDKELRAAQAAILAIEKLD